MPRRGLIVYSQSVVHEVNSLKSTFNLIKVSFVRGLKISAHLYTYPKMRETCDRVNQGFLPALV